MELKTVIINHFAGNYRPFFEQYLDSLKRSNGAAYMAKCPFHFDENPSLSVNIEKGLYKCFGCDESGDIFSFHQKIRGNGSFPDTLESICRDFNIPFNGAGSKKVLKNGDNLKKKRKGGVAKNGHKQKPFEHYKLGFPATKYPYKSETGEILYYNCRFILSDGDKTFRQCRPDGLSWKVKGLPQVPYQLPELQKALNEEPARMVFCVEGEKDVDNLNKLGFSATCNSAGAGKWTDEHSKYLKDCNVCILPDNDDTGRDHAHKVAESLSGVAKSVKLVILPDLAEKGDVSDYLSTFDDPDDAGERLSILIEQANPYEPPKIYSFGDAIILTKNFMELPTPERKAYLFPWLKEDSIILVSGWRGCGKTWFALGIIDAVTRGKPFGPWECQKSVPCLFLDGEMTIHDDKERIERLMLDTERQSPLYIYSDAYANQLGLPRAHLGNESWRQKMKQILITKKIKLFVIDNIASLASGIDENKKQDWDPINQWFLELRFAGISTIMLHHVNKDGGQRGTSAREDNLDISIMLKAPHDYTPEDGARFICHFGKARISTGNLNLVADTEFKLTQDDNGYYSFTSANVRKERKKEVISLLEEGYEQKAIAETLDISKGYVSQIKKKAVNDGLITKDGKLTQSGLMSLGG